ncbi:hypothetical protein [Superficieibacter sp. 1612_C1]|uniref:hypothetical protein n=1 Tax=Superficieibacter sp. 1612_C1 TaxID=2780382 RepID=UPI0018845AEF|nr:hypothetical protein [Superficieibacter sp. 1612_C1]
MITKSSILTDFTDKNRLSESISNLLSVFDIDFTILNYDYFDVDGYKEFVRGGAISIEEDLRFIDLLSEIDFLYEIDFGTSLNSIESNYLPSLTDFISQSLSSQLSCNMITSFKPLSSDEYCPVTYFSKDKEIINFICFASDFWSNVSWVKLGVSNKKE